MKCFPDRTDLFKSFNAFRRFKDSRPFHVQGSMFNERQNRSTLPRFGNSRNGEITAAALRTRSGDRRFKPFHHNSDARSNGSTSLTMSGISRSIALRSLSAVEGR